MIRQTAKLVAIAILFTACREDVDNGQLKELTKRLEYSNILIGQFNEKTLSELKEEMWRPYLERADQRAIENGQTVNGLSSWLFNYVESIKGNVTREKANELYDRLVRHKQQLLNLIQPVDYMVRSYYDREKKHFFESLTVLDFINDSASLSAASGYSEKWVNDNFSSGDTLATQASLLKIKNDILVSEQILLKYFKAKTAVLICGHYQQDAAVAVLNSSYIKAGEAIEVTAGIGHFSSASIPTITIDGKQVLLNREAHARYSFRPKVKPGKYSLPIEFEYYKPDGTKEKVFRYLSYTIAQ